MKKFTKIIYFTIRGIKYGLFRVPPKLAGSKIKSIAIITEEIITEVIPVVEAVKEWGEYLICKLEDNESPVKFIDIICVVVSKPYCFINVDGRRYVKHKGSLESMKNLFPPDDFYCIKNNCTVSKFHIIRVDTGDTGYVYSTADNKNLISREIKPSFNRWRKA